MGKKKGKPITYCPHCGARDPNPTGEGHCKSCGGVVNPAKAST